MTLQHEKTNSTHEHNHKHHHTTQELSADAIVERGLKQLKASGFKMTKKREEILRLFAENQRYISAKYVHQQLSEHYPTMSYNTTYRNIYDFVEEGLLESTEYNQEQMFRINCWTCEHHHHHFICTVCGRTIPLDVCPLASVNTDLSHVDVEWHRFEIFGKCDICKKEEKSTSQA